MKNFKFIIAAFLFSIGISTAFAEYEVTGGATLYAGAGSSDFAPYYMRTNRHGRITQSKNVLIDAFALDSLNLNKRFDWSWGVEALGGWSNSADYSRFLGQNTVVLNPQHPARIWLQQLYAEVKYRGIFLNVGLKDRNSSLVDEYLSSGDLVWSGNTRGIPEVRAGFVDFQDIPFTNKWLQIEGCISYGKFVDTDWIRNHYNYERGKINPGNYWTYKRVYFRTNPTKPFHAKFGVQMTGLFGGTTSYYDHGALVKEVHNYQGVKDFITMLFPFGHGREGYKTGDHKGSWDISLQYRFHNQSTLRAYTQFFWEDGTGMSKSNGWDGLYGLEFRPAKISWLKGVVVEYMDFTHQGGPFHYDPSDVSGATLPAQARGRDDYYNNSFYRAYTNYGLTIGTPLVMGVLYQLDGNAALEYNRVRAIHVAAEGNISDEIAYIAKYNHRKAWGQTNTMQLLHPHEADSWMIGAKWRMPMVKGLTLQAEVGADFGNLPQKAFGVMVSANYTADFLFKKQELKTNGRYNTQW